MSISELREHFEIALATNLKNDLYYEEDVHRLKNDDSYAEAFLLHNLMNMEAAVKQIDICFCWRKQQYVCSLLASQFSSEIHKMGSIYWHSNDKAGHRILHFIFKDDLQQQRDVSFVIQMKQFIVWQLEQEYQRNPARKIVILFYMPETVNIDLDLVKFLIACFTTYFPNFLAYALVYEMPASLNNVWNIIKGWLDEKVHKRIVFVTMKEIQNYIDGSCLSTRMGGTDDFQFSHVAEEDNVNVVKLANAGTPTEECCFLAQLAENTTTTTTLRQRNKRVSFNETSCDNFSPLAGGTTMVERNGILRSNSLNIATQQRPESTNHLSRCISVFPTDQLEFVLAAGNVEIEIENMFSLTNLTSRMVAFKVKTTSPEDYRVRPSCGVIQADTSIQIQVTFKQTRLTRVNDERSDKFQILALTVPADTTCDKVAQLIKCATRENLQEHRLLCHLLLPTEKSQFSFFLQSEETTLTQMRNLAASMSRRLDAVEDLMKSSLNYLRFAFWLCATTTMAFVLFFLWRRLLL